MLQVVQRDVTFPFTFLDWRNETTDSKDSMIKELVKNNERLLGFDLSKAPLIRLKLIQISSNEYWFVWSFTMLFWMVGHCLLCFWI